jgi:hypothetical protein
MRPSMNTILIIPVAILLLAALPCSAQTDSFDRGYEQGYQAENPNSITPIAPIPSIPEPGQTNFQEGIKEGAEQGLEEKGQDYQSGVDDGVQQEQDDSSNNGDSDQSGDGDSDNN